MGIPAFYRLLVERYPKCIVKVVEKDPTVNDVHTPIDLCEANPNGIEFDNLYLDMNAIIHPCFHPEGLPPPETCEDIFTAVFQYVDRIFSIIRPRKLLFMAVDGVAPRAKMNQQRTRRFRAAKDASDEISKRQSSKQSKRDFPPLIDSNVITPGTEFMSFLSSALQYYIAHRMNMDSGWQGIKVILSDASVPGEGEHKIISYVRLQRNLPEFDPNTRHCLYGLDADLIMLALASHELNFSVLREDVRNTKLYDKNVTDFIRRQEFQFLHVWILREYLAHELRIPDDKFEPNLDRLIDDFVFMCMFVGNDFLPHVPSLEISEGAIDLLMSVYKKEFVQMGGYLTNNGFEVNLERLQHFIQAVGAHENSIFYKRLQVQKGRGLLLGKSRTNKLNVNGHKCSVSNAAKSLIDKVRLGEEGFKERYYAEKFGARTKEDLERVRKQSVQKYIEGICWVMRYYYEGVCSWQWFYPYHYAPFASDLYDLNQLEVQFTLGKPFKPYNQLMAVLPAARDLMMDRSSPIFDFYPTDFELDMNGKQRSWQAVCKLPFIDESRLLLATAKLEHTLTDDEKQRNRVGMDILFVHELHSLATKIILFVERNNGHLKLTCGKVKRKINPKASGGMNGFFYISEKPVWPVEIPSPIIGMEPITGNKVLSVYYKCPSFHPHIPSLPHGALMPKPSIRTRHIQPPPVLWHDKPAKIGYPDLKRHIPNCIFGPCLAKFAHRLVAQQSSLAKLERQEGCLIVSEVGVVSLDDKKCKLENANQSVSTDLQNPVNGSDHVEPNKKRKRISQTNQATNEKSVAAAVTGVVSLDDKKCKPEDANESVSTDLQNPVIGSPHVEPSKRKKKIKKRIQATDEKSAAVTGVVSLDDKKCNPEDADAVTGVVSLDDKKCNPEDAAAVTGQVSLDDKKLKPEDAYESVSTDLQNPVIESPHVEPNKRKKKIRKRIQATDEKSAAVTGVVSLDDKKCNPEDSTAVTGVVSLDDKKCNPEDAAAVTGVVILDDEKCMPQDAAAAVTGVVSLDDKKCNPEDAAAVTGVVSLDDKKCKPEDANESVSTDLQNSVIESPNVEPNKRKKKMRKRIQATDEKSVSVTGVVTLDDKKCNLEDAAAVTGVVSLDDEKCKPEDANESVSTDLQNPVIGSHHVEPNIKKKKISKRNQATDEKSAAVTGVVSLEDKKCKPESIAAVTGVVSLVDEKCMPEDTAAVIGSHPVEPNKKKKKISKRNQAINEKSAAVTGVVSLDHKKCKPEDAAAVTGVVSLVDEKCMPEDAAAVTGVVSLDDKKCKPEADAAVTGVVSLDNKKCMPEDANGSVSTDLQNPVIETLHAEPNKKKKKISKRNQATNENIAAVTGVVSLDDKKSKPEDVAAANESVSTDLQSPVNGSHLVEPNKKRKKISKRNQATNEKSAAAAVTGKCDDLAKRKQEKVELSHASESSVLSLNEPISTGLLNGVNGNHHEESVIKRLKINQGNENCDDADLVENIQKKVEPSEVSGSVVSVDNEKFKPEVDELISTGLLNMVSVSHHDEPGNRSVKKRRANQANKKSCDVDSVKQRQEIGKSDEVEAEQNDIVLKKKVETNQVRDSVVSVDELVSTGLLNMVNESHHDEPDNRTSVKKRRRTQTNRISNDAAVTGECNVDASVKPRQEIVEPNQVSGKSDEVEAEQNHIVLKKKVETNQVWDSVVSVDEPVSTPLLNMVNESHHDEPYNRTSVKKRRRSQTNRSSNDTAVTGECNDGASVKPRQEIVEPNQVSGKSDEVEAEQNDIVLKKIVKPNQVGDSVVVSVDEPVSTGLLNLVNETHQDEPNNTSVKKRRRSQTSKKSNDTDSVNAKQEIVELNQVIVSVDTEKCKLKVDEPVLTGLGVN